MRNTLTERDLSRIVKRVINEGLGGNCDQTNFGVMETLIKYNKNLTVTYNQPSRGFVTVSTNSTGTTRFPCVCRKEELLPYIQ